MKIFLTSVVVLLVVAGLCDAKPKRDRDGDRDERRGGGGRRGDMEEFQQKLIDAGGVMEWFKIDADEVSPIQKFS
jgi:hypothetical protein